MDKQNIYFTKCSSCQQTFSARYFSRHKCLSSDNSVIEVETHKSNEEVDQEMYAHESFSGDVHSDIDDIGNDSDDSSGNTNIEQEHFDFDELLDEAFFAEETDFTSDNSKSVSLIRWFCLFLAHWQKIFNITDNALYMLLKFMYTFLSIILPDAEGVALQRDVMLKNFPKTVYSFRKILGVNRKSYKKYVVCSKCCCLYEPADCIIKHGGVEFGRKCIFVKFPNHTQQHLRKKCGTELMTEIKLPSGKKKLLPKKVYCYKSIKESLQTLLNRPGFEEECDKWRKREESNFMNDVYDGEIWKTFQRNDELYFDRFRNYGLMLNVDWFQPYKHLSSYSIGPIYLVLLNLPRHLRFKRQNVILVGLIPNMDKEPPCNTFLNPLVEELEEGWSVGYQLKSKSSGRNESFHVALLCVGCDIPATRKLCGFLGHSASRGCSKCNKLFPGRVGERDYSGFDLQSWEARTTTQHRTQMHEILQCNTLQDQNKLESQFGTRFSVLALLPYYDTVRMNVVDPMHNLFLGSAKHMLKIWKELGYLNKQNLEKIQQKTDSFALPHDIGKIPRKIVSGFDGFNADEYKNWLLLFSMFSIEGIVPTRDQECLRKLVLACTFLCKKRLSQNDITIAHGFLLQFCQDFQNLYGYGRVTPNMHLHMHIKDCVKDYGPIYGFWLFSFERYNGLLGSLPTNKHLIELQIMGRFCCENVVLNIEKPPAFREYFDSIFGALNSISLQRGTLQEIEMLHNEKDTNLASRLLNPSSENWYMFSTYVIPQSKRSIYAISNFQMETLKKVYLYLYSSLDESNVVFQESYERFTEVMYNNVRYGSSESKSCRSSFVMAFWCKDGADILSFDEMELSPRPGVIRYFMKHSFTINDNIFEHWFACCDWYHKVDEQIKNKFGKPTEVWYRRLHEPFGPASFIPVQRIFSKFVHAPYEWRSKELMVVVPRITSSI